MPRDIVEDTEALRKTLPSNIGYQMQTIGNHRALHELVLERNKAVKKCNEQNPTIINFNIQQLDA